MRRMENGASQWTGCGSSAWRHGWAVRLDFRGSTPRTPRVASGSAPISQMGWICPPRATRSASAHAAPHPMHLTFQPPHKSSPVLAAQGPVAPLSEEIFCPLFEDNSENVSVPESEADAPVASPPELPTATLWLAMRGTERDDAPTADAEHLQQEEEARSGTPAWDDLSPLVDLDGFQ
mmetsp:Transcript_91193/g.136577  ORF Transcript_91193/g.136577 Transcript_91193/m.136577 type:complete len:178 (-) Transcript_91193:193-726(-)